MTAASVFLLAAAAAAAVGTIAADTAGRFSLARILRPAAMASIIALAAVLPASTPPAYRLFILAGLSVSLVGDFFMMAEKKKFTAGVIAFLAAQFFYVAAFLQTRPASFDFMTALPFLVYAFFMMGVLYPRLGSKKAPITLYIGVMTVMAILAAQRYISMGGKSAFYALIGAGLFVASDTILALDRYSRKIPAAQIFILGTYFPAQIFFALSV